MPKVTPRLVAGSPMSPCGGGRGWSSSSIPSTEPRGKAVARKGAGGSGGLPGHINTAVHLRCCQQEMFRAPLQQEKQTRA